MNHLRQSNAPTLCNKENACHPERNLAKSEANRQTESKDLVLLDSATGTAGNFRIVVRFLDEHDLELRPMREMRRI